MRKYLFLLILVMGVAGCSKPPAHYAAETLGLGYIKRIVVLPFENNTDSIYAHQRFRDTVTTEILRRGLFEVVEDGEAKRFLREELVRKNQESLDLETARRLGQELNVEAYMAGAVEDFSMRTNGNYSYPVVAATLRIVDVKTGQIIWQSTDSASGYNTSGRLFGFVGEDINQVSFTLARRMLGTIASE